MPKDIDPDLVQEIKTAIRGKLEEHFSSEERELLLLGSVMDPRFKCLKFLSSTRSGVYQDLITDC